MVHCSFGLLHYLIRLVCVLSQVLQADEVASGVRPAGYVDPDQEYPSGEEDEYEEVTVSCHARVNVVCFPSPRGVVL